MANTYKALQTVTVGAGGTSSISFTNIPQTYTDLHLLISARDNDPGHASAYHIALNGTNWGSNKELYVYNGTTAYGTTAGETAGTGGGATANAFGNASVYIPNYVSSNSKILSGDAVSENNSTTNYYIVFHTANSGITEPITSISINTGGVLFSQYSTATLYGIFNADVSSAPDTPTIGTATATGPTTATVSFTPVSNSASYTATSTPGSITATAASSPISVTGLTADTAYTFTVKSNNPFGSSANSSASNSVTPSAAQFESIATVTVGSGGSSSIDFTSIPSTYTHLQIRFLYGNTDAAQTRETTMRLNSDSGNNYADHQLSGNGGSMSSSASTSTNAIYIAQCDHSSSGGSSDFGVSIVDILDYTNTNKYKTTKQVWGWDGNGTGVMRLSSGLWMNTNAITSIKLLPMSTGNFKEYTHAALYGIRST